MKIKDVLKENLFIAELESTTKEAVLLELTKKLYSEKLYKRSRRFLK